MSGEAQSDFYWNDEAVQPFESRRRELPEEGPDKGRACARNPIRLADISFREDFGFRDNWRRFELHAPVEMDKSRLRCVSVFLGGNLVDSVVVTSRNADMVERVDVDESAFFDRTLDF